MFLKRQILLNLKKFHQQKADVVEQNSISPTPSQQVGSTSFHRDSPVLSEGRDLVSDTEDLESLMDALRISNDTPPLFDPVAEDERHDQRLESMLTAATVTTSGGSARHHNKFFMSSDDFHGMASHFLPDSLAPLSPADAIQSVQAIVDRRSNPNITAPTDAIPTLEQDKAGFKLMSAPTRPVSRSSLTRPHAFVRPRRSVNGHSKASRDAKSILNFIETDIDRLHAELFGDEISLSSAEEQLKVLDSASCHIENGFKRLDSIRVKDADILHSKSVVAQKLNNLNAKVSAWYSELPEFPVTVDATHAYAVPIDFHDDVTQVLSILAIICNVILFLSRNSCDFIIGVATLLVKLTMSTMAGALDQSEDRQRVPGKDAEDTGYTLNQKEILKRLPPNLPAALKNFNIDGKFQFYAACPSCNYTHSGTSPPGSAKIVFPDLCRNRVLEKMGNVICGATLLRVRKDGSHQPVKPFLVSSFSEYLVRTLADAEFLEQSIQATDKALQSIRNDGFQVDSESRNVFESKFLREFKGPDGNLFVDRGTKIRLAFSLHVDFFNPNGSRKRGNHNSIGVISAANLALDSSIRYLPEYIFVAAVIPGPKEPPLGQTDHYLRPVIEQFASAWRPGMHISRTANSLSGAIAESAIIISVNDLPAARKIAGFQGVTSNFICSICRLYGQDGIFSTDFDQWVKRDLDQLRAAARAWRDASSFEERNHIYTEHGVRWSSLWLLEYWDPTRMLVIDSMHCLLEGLIHYHCRHVLQLDAAKVKANDEGLQYAFTFPWVPYDNECIPDNLQVAPHRVGDVSKIQDMLCFAFEGEHFITPTQLWSRLERKSKPALRYVADTLGLGFQRNGELCFQPKQQVAEMRCARLLAKASKQGKSPPPIPPIIPIRSKADYSDLLLNWRLDQPLSPSQGIPKTGTLSILNYIQFVVINTLTPSWINSVPSNYGEASAGTIKADEWRTLATVYLPIALVTLWGDSEDEDVEFTPLLSHSMALFQAVNIACRYTMTASRANEYRKYLKLWVEHLHVLYPHTEQHRARPNIHAAAHIFDFLEEFGPMLSWWCFPFERLIGTLQKINTNERIGGTLERTIIESQARGANIRRWLKRPECPQAIKEVKSLFDKTFLPVDTHPEALNYSIPVAGQSLSHYRHGGLVYSRKVSHPGNATIIYWPTSSSKSVAGQIEDIISTGTSVLFYVRRQAPLPPSQYDPFSRYSHFPAMVYSSEMLSLIDKITPEQIISHGARFDFSNNRAVICNLLRS